MSNYHILIGDLDQDAKCGDVLMINPEDYTKARLERNLDEFWAWNLWRTFNADGPAVFLNWNKTGN